MKIYEPIFLLGAHRFQNLNIRVRVRGGGPTTQVMAIRQAICKGIISFYQKFRDESEKRELKELLLQYDKTPLVADPRRCEPKKFGGREPELASKNPTDERFLTLGCVVVKFCTFCWLVLSLTVHARPRFPGKFTA